MSVNKKAKKKKVVLIIFAVILIILLLCVGAVWLLFKNYLRKIDFDHDTEADGIVQVENTLTDEEIIQELLAEEEITDETDTPEDAITELEQQMINQLNKQESKDSLVSDEGYVNILLVGCDSRKKGGVGRSDAMILVSVNEETEKIHLTSIMRDCYVAIPGKSNNRINAAYAFGGGSLLLDTVKANFAVDVDRYVAFDFYSFIDIVDTIGGIDVEVSEAELKILNGYVMDLNAINETEVDDSLLDGTGIQHLNGKQALCYSRIRHTGNGDFERTERQREVIGAIFNQAKSLSLTEINDLLNVFLPEIKTNLTEEEILKLLLNVMEYLTYELDSLRLPVEGSYQSLRINKMAVLGIDLEKNQKALEEFIAN